MVKDAQNVCKWCGASLGKDEFHEEFNFYKHPLVVQQYLRPLRTRLNTLAPDQKVYEMENWAITRVPPLIYNAKIAVINEERVEGMKRTVVDMKIRGKYWPITEEDCEKALGQKYPTGGSVVMPGYGRLEEAYLWLLKLEEKDREIDVSRPEPVSDPSSLPF